MSNIKLNVPIEIRWDNRYSSTMEDDKQGRWARVAYAGRFKGYEIENGFELPAVFVSYWEIACVKKCQDKFTVYTYFPIVITGVFDTVDEAKAAVERYFRWFIEMCINN